MFLNNFYKLNNYIVDVCFRFVILPLFNRYSFIYGQYVSGKEICQSERNWSFLQIFTLSKPFIVHIDGVSSTYCQVCLLCHHMKRRDLFGGWSFWCFLFYYVILCQLKYEHFFKYIWYIKLLKITAYQCFLWRVIHSTQSEKPTFGLVWHRSRTNAHHTYPV